MKDIEKGIKELEHVRQTDFDMSEPTKNAIDNVLELLKEQKPTTFKPHYIDEYGKHFIYGVECGACHKEISSTYHYCPWCGRVVK